MRGAHLLLLVGLDPVCDLQPQVAKFLAKSLPSDAQQAHRLVLIAIGELQNATEQNSIDFAMRDGIEVVDVGR